MKKINKCVLVVSDQSDDSKAMRYSCDANYGNCTHMVEGESPLERSRRGNSHLTDYIPNCKCRFMGAMRMDWTIPCLNRKARKEILSIVNPGRDQEAQRAFK